MGDADRIEQVFINIIDNAIKYTPAGGAINVDVVPEEGCISVRIVDTGAGIPADKLDRVKEKFFKANSTVRGSGIGLAVADEIIKIISPVVAMYDVGRVHGFEKERGFFRIVLLFPNYSLIAPVG